MQKPYEEEVTQVIDESMRNELPIFIVELEFRELSAPAFKLWQFIKYAMQLPRRFELPMPQNNDDVASLLKIVPSDVPRVIDELVNLRYIDADEAKAGCVECEERDLRFDPSES